MGLFQELIDKLKAWGEKILEAIEPAVDRILSFIPADKQKPVLICAGATVLSLFLVIIISLAMKPGKPEKAQEFAIDPRFAIPGEELFLPEEPDLVPAFLPAREPKTIWTVEDVRPFWREIGKDERDLWQDEMSAIVDDIMETVP